MPEGVGYGNGAVFQLHGPNADLRMRPDPVTQAIQQAFTPNVARVPLNEQSPTAVPFNVPFMDDPRMRSRAENVGSEGGVPKFPGVGNIPGIGIQDIFTDAFWNTFYPYEPPPGATPEEPVRTGSALGGGGSLLQPGGEGALAAAFGNRQEQTFDSRIPIPATGEETFDTAAPPTLQQSDIDAFVEELQGLVPEKYQKEKVSSEAFLAGMGAGAQGAGTVGEFLLGAGTGGMGTIAQHNENERAIARESDAARRQMLADIAVQAFGAQGKKLETERAAANFEQRRNQLAAQQDTQRINAIAQRTNVQVSGDNIVVSEPVYDEQGNITDKVQTKILTQQDVSGILDSVALGGSGADLASLDLPDIGGEDIKQRFAGLGIGGRGDLLTAAHLVQGTIPESAVAGVLEQMGVQDAGNVMQNAMQTIRNRALEKVKARFFSEGDFTMEEGRELSLTNLTTAASRLAEVDSDKVLDAAEEEMYKEVLLEMNRDPTLQAAVWMASDIAQLQQMALIKMQGQ